MTSSGRMMEPSLGPRQTTEASTPQALPRAHRTRIGRRVLTLFIISALVPLGLSAAILYSQFSSGLRVAQQRSLDELARSYGMTILGRLEAADEALRLFTSEAEGGDTLAESRANRLS